MVGHTNLDERAAADFDRVRGKAFLRSVAARLRNGRSSEIEVGATEFGPSAVRSSMDAGITGGLTLFGTRDSGE